MIAKMIVSSCLIRVDRMDSNDRTSAVLTLDCSSLLSSFVDVVAESSFSTVADNLVLLCVVVGTGGPQPFIANAFDVGAAKR